MGSLLFREIATLETLESSMHGPESLVRALPSIVDSIAHLTGADRVALILIDTRERRVRHFVRGGAGWPEVMTTVGYDELFSGLTGCALRTGEIVLSPKDVPDPRESEEVQFRRRQTHCGSILVVPLGPDGDRQGTITLINRPEQRDFTDDDARTMRLYSPFVTSAIRLHAAREAAAQAKKEANAAIRSKMSFLSNLSHELRTPLNGILGFSRLLEDTRLDDSQRSMVRTILQSGNRLLGTIDNILELAQFEAGQFHLENAPFSPQSVLEILCRDHASLAAEKGLAWNTSFGPGIPMVVDGDAIRLKQAWAHLLSNAVKFTAEGSITVHLESRRLEARRYELVLTVTDTGIGLSGDRSGRWFSPFHQEDGSLTRKFGGTGLGLALCDRIVRSMGGGLSLRGVAGQGTTARAWVELGTEGYPVIESSPGIRVLLQEIDPGNRLVLVKMLERSGHRVDVVSDLGQVRERLATDDYEVVMLAAVAPSAERDSLKEVAVGKGVSLVGLFRTPDASDEFPWGARLSLPPQDEELNTILEKCVPGRAP